MSNDGTAKSKGGRGATILTPYGKDSSDWCGTASDERGGEMGGGTSNLSHSLTGATPKQTGK